MHSGRMERPCSTSREKGKGNTGDCFSLSLSVCVVECGVRVRKRSGASGAIKRIRACKLPAMLRPCSSDTTSGEVFRCKSGTTWRYPTRIRIVQMCFEGFRSE